MKVGLYWEHGYFQAILTPENEHEKKVCDLIGKDDSVQVKRGEFYHCQGGWVRHGETDESVMLIMKEKDPTAPEVAA